MPKHTGISENTKHHRGGEKSMTYLIPLTALIIGLVTLITIIKRNTLIISKTDPENIQLILDIKQKAIKGEM
jgi:hypothetical protein